MALDGVPMPVSRFSSFVLVLLLCAGCVPSTGQVERGLERELAQLLGPADRYDVEIDGLRARSGEAERVTVVGERVRAEGAPVIERLELDLRGVVYDRDEERLERVESARGTVQITGPDLAAFLGAYRNVRDAEVTLREPDGATIRVRPEFGGVALPRGVAAEVTGRLEAADGRVHFAVSEVEAAGFDLGSAAARRLSEAINPLVDLSDVAAGLRVTDVRVEDGVVRLDAAGDITGLRLRKDDS